MYVDALELKIPPVGVGIVAVIAMWLLSTFVPGGDIAIPGLNWVAAALYWSMNWNLMKVPGFRIQSVRSWLIANLQQL